MTKIDECINSVENAITRVLKYNYEAIAHEVLCDDLEYKLGEICRELRDVNSHNSEELICRANIRLDFAQDLLGKQMEDDYSIKNSNDLLHDMTRLKENLEILKKMGEQND